MNIIYNKETGEIFSAISEGQDYKRYYRDWGKDFVNGLESLKVDNVPMNLGDYYVKDGQLVKHTEQEIEEKRLYGRILTEEERLLNKLKPTPKEVQKAENTIEILTLIQEVM